MDTQQRFGRMGGRAVPSILASRGLGGVPQMGWLLVRE